ncbi:hypothetical protein [Streptomyces sp. NBC_01373]|uniref:hypothetical protein n=1 Tax=Streptomyces sp. NBC_01373 TaxID=2903843 RepID=UPI002258C9BD|nr:hypothetical protein [Streptomyces sp. NBC_01373]MCX4706949.1 hypothetical protein [Streptomyces sp. NBC_01373]
MFFTVLALFGLAGITQAGATTTASGDFTAVSPSAKIVDTRSALGVSAALGAASTNSFQVLGQGGVPSSGVSAVSLDITAANATSSGSYLELWPDGTTRPYPASVIDFSSSADASNSAIIAVGSDGKIDVYNSSGTADLIVNVNGYFTSDGGATSPGGYVPVTQSRLVDTRNGTGAPQAEIAPGGTLNVQIDGVDGITGEGSVYANVTVPFAGSAGSLYAYATGGAAGQPVVDYKSVTTSQGAVIPVGTGGQITLKNGSSTQSVDVVLDVYGYFTQASSGGGVFTAAQDRLLDTRTSTAIPADSSVSVTVAGNDGIPTSFGAAVLNLTTTGQQNSGYLRVWPTGQPMPSTTSVDNFQANTSTADLVIAQPGDQGAVSIYNASSGTIQLIVDLQGWFSIDGNDDSGTLTTLPPVDPPETDLTDAPTDPAAATSEPAAATDSPSSGIAPAGVYCDPGGVYKPTSLGGRYIRAIGPYQSNYNGTSNTESTTFTAEASGTVGITLSGSLKVSLNELVSRQEVTYGINLSASLTAKLGNSVTAKIPPHTTVSAKYGVWRRRITGTSFTLYSNCVHSTSSTIVSYTPYTVGWYTWQS